MYDIIENVYNPSQINGKNWWENIIRTSLVVQWLRLHVSTAGGSGSSLAGKLRSHMLWRMAKIYFLKKKENIYLCIFYIHRYSSWLNISVNIYLTQSFCFWPHCAAHRISHLSNQGLNPGPWPEKLQVLTTGLPGKFFQCQFFKNHYKKKQNLIFSSENL